MRHQPYVESPRRVGAGHVRVVRSYVLPNVSAAIVVLATTRLGAAVFGFNMLGDALRDILDPRLRSR